MLGIKLSFSFSLFHVVTVEATNDVANNSIDVIINL